MMTDAEFLALKGKAPWWHGGAAPSEVIRFVLSPSQPGDGTRVGQLDDELLCAYLAEASNRLRDSSTATEWMRFYARRLATEARRRAESMAS